MEKRPCVRANVILFFRGQVLAGQHKDGEIGCPRIVAPLGEQLESAHLRQNQVKDYEFGQVGCNLGARLCAIGSSADSVSSPDRALEISSPTLVFREAPRWNPVN